MSAEILAAAFHDTPGLLAVRLVHPGRSVGAGFAVTRRADSGGGKSSSNGCGGLVIAGVIAVMWMAGNVGSCSHDGGDGQATRPVQPSISAPLPSDAGGSRAWLDRADDLGDDYEPQRADLRPWSVRALLDVPRELARRGSATGGWLQPACSGADKVAHARGKRLAEQLVASGLAPGTAVVLDLPGSQAVATGAGMATAFDPVFTSDSLPHPYGVVTSAQTLAAALYWRPLVAGTRGRRGDAPPPCFILEGDRLAPYANQADRFDNRTHARLPGADALRSLGVTRLLYVRANRGSVAEADDLNALFAALPAAGIDVRHMGLDAVELADERVEAEPAEATARSAHSWLWLRTGWGAAGTGQPDADAAYRARPRPLGAMSFDGGAAQRGSILEVLKVRPPPSAPSSSGSSGFSSGSSGHSGGSWFRSSSSHHYGS